MRVIREACDISYVRESNDKHIAMAMAFPPTPSSTRFLSLPVPAALPSSSTFSSIHSSTRLHFKSRAVHSSRSNVSALQAFSGLTVSNRLKLRTEQAFPGISNGCRWFAMRHGKRVPKLNRPADQRKALLRGLTTELLRHGRIKTTRAKASATRKHVEHMITLAKGGSLHQRRQALGFIYDKQLVHALFAEVPARYGERNGGYTRIIRTMPRRGDNAPMAFIELV